MARAVFSLCFGVLENEVRAVYFEKIRAGDGTETIEMRTTTRRVMMTTTMRRAAVTRTRTPGVARKAARREAILEKKF